MNFLRSLLPICIHAAMEKKDLGLELVASLCLRLLPYPYNTWLSFHEDLAQMGRIGCVLQKTA